MIETKALFFVVSVSFYNWGFVDLKIAKEQAVPAPTQGFNTYWECKKTADDWAAEHVEWLKRNHYVRHEGQIVALCEQRDIPIS